MRNPLPTLVALLSLTAIADAEPLWEGSWARAGLSEYTVLSLAMDPGDARVLYAGTNVDGVFVSVDGGYRWSVHNDGLADGNSQNIRELRLDPADSGVLYAATKGGLYRSVALGAWESMGVTGGATNPNPISADGLSIDPGDGNRIFVSGDSVLMRATDGATFEQVPDVNAWTVNHATADPDLMFAGRFAETYRSTDGGDTWAPVSLDDLIDRGSTSVYLNEFHFDPLDATEVFLTTIQGGPRLSLSTDAGVSFPTRANFPGATIEAFAIDPLDTTVVYASAGSAFGGNGTWYSTDGGTEWTPFPNEESPTRIFNDFALSPMDLDDDRLYGGRTLNGVMVFSKDRVFHSAFEPYE